MKMKLKLQVTSQNYEKYKPLLSEFGYEEEITYSDWYEPDWLHKEKWRITYVNATIEINSIQELLELAKRLPNNQHEIIINGAEDEGSPYIEIYDKFRET